MIRTWETYTTKLNQAAEALLIREIAAGDAETAAQLCEQLGYPVSVEAIKERIANVQTLQDRVVFVGSVLRVVVGWIDVGIIHHLQAEPHGEIGGFVISSEYRSKGIGQKLLAQAEHWVASRGISRIVVRSQIKREAAHRFYLREGYSQTKTSAVFSKDLKSG
ncbi:MAG: GNAT family N-acetyltransferase [Bryobacteraceae bacterium]